MRLIDADYLKEKGHYDDYDEFVVDYDDIKNAPTIDPVKHGRWKKAYADHVAFGERPFYRYCSECCEVTVFPYKFCPHCGAYMIDEEE